MTLQQSLQVKARSPKSASNAIEGEYFWSEQFKRYEGSQLPRKTFCRQEGLDYDRFQYWYHKLVLNKAKPNQESQNQTTLMPVTLSGKPVISSPAVQAALCRICLPGGREVVVENSNSAMCIVK